uniref:Trafficking protein particle complex subunit 11 domain-containing protein n=1 Tax=Meloidogyne javanica TaxID=6303 RepID=A0A915LHR7_MELJA
TPPNDSISIKNKTRGIIKYNWQYKYLDERPALIVLFIDLDWDSDMWLQQKNECESRLNVLRQSIGQLETKLALVLIQKAKTTVDDSIATEKAIEICQFCKISTRQFYVFPLLTDKKATAECIVRLEIAFYQIAQEAYQAYFKKIRARSVPNNDQQVLLRQQFKLAFISELREDRHSSLRYYKQAYQIAADLEMLELFIYELINIAGFLNYKICELNFILNSPLEALNQFRKHSSNFFNRQMGNYPSKELAIIEFELWKSQQQNIQENYSQSIQLFSAAIGQFKRYHCKRFATLSYLNIAKEYICFKQFGNSLQILQHVSTELRTSSFYLLLRNVLLLMANCAYCSLNINEWILAIVQILHSEMTNLNAQIEPNLLEDAQNYFSGHSSIPFPILPNSPFYEEEICSIRPQWEQNLSVNEGRRQQNLFQLEFSQLGNYSFLNCEIRFLPVNINKTTEFEEENENKYLNIRSEDSLPIEPKIGKEFFEENLNKQQNRAQSPSSGNKNIYLDICIRSFAVRLPNGCFIWESVKSTKSLVDNSCYLVENSFIRVIPRHKRLSIVGPPNKINLYIDESIEIGFSLLNNLEDCEDLNNVRIICQKVYCEEDSNIQQQRKVVQQKFDSAPILNTLNLNDSVQGYTFVPIFNQEISEFFAKEKSVDFSVRLQSKSNNCVALNIKNDNLTKKCEYPPFSQILNEQYKKLGIISDETNNSNLFKNDVYVEILPEIIGEESKQSSIGEVIVEWRR